jgi:hypothetical protein
MFQSFHGYKPKHIKVWTELACHKPGALVGTKKILFKKVNCFGSRTHDVASNNGTQQHNSFPAERK